MDDHASLAVEKKKLEAQNDELQNRHMQEFFQNAILMRTLSIVYVKFLREIKEKEPIFAQQQVIRMGESLKRL